LKQVIIQINFIIFLQLHGFLKGRFSFHTCDSYRFWYWSFRVCTLLFHNVIDNSYGIAPRIVEPGQKPRIEVFNPCDDSDDQKTSTAILFDDEGNFIAFGQHALQRYAEMLDDEETAMLFQTYKMHLLHMDVNAKSVDGRDLSLMKVISESLRYIAEKAIEKLSE
jgi:hypothetical protein